MKVFTEKSKDIAVYGEYDVLVVGGGTAGVVAAISAAREGMKVLIVEQFGSLGGSATLAMVTPVMHSGIPGNPLCSSISAEINNYLISEGFGYKNGDNSGYHDPLYLRNALDTLTSNEPNIKILFHTYFADVIKEGNTLNGIIIENKAGRQAIFAKRIIDASGDADVAVRAGAAYEKGNPKTGKNQPISLRYILGGIDLDKFAEFLGEVRGSPYKPEYPLFYWGFVSKNENPLKAYFLKAIEAGDLCKEDVEYWQIFGIPGRHDGLAFNCPEFFDELDGTNPDVLSKTHIQGRARIAKQLKFYKKYFKGFENAYIAEYSEMIGIRESVRIISEYVLTAEDVVKRRKFEDSVCQSNYPVDVHGAGDDYLCKILESEDRDPVPYYEIPYLTMVPQGFDNLLVAGRSIGCDFIAQSSIRVQHSCRALGEAAGIACAESIKGNIILKDIKGRIVREKMLAKGAVFANL